MFTSLRSRLRSLRNEGDTDTRIARKARKAERQVTQTATTDLRVWEEAQGYRRTSYISSPSISPTASSSFKEQPIASGLSSGNVSDTTKVYDTDAMVSSKGKDSVLTSLPSINVESSGLSDSSYFALPKPSVSNSPYPSIILSPLEQPQDSTHVPSMQATQGRDETVLRELEEKEALLKEIQNIRKTISDLRNGVSSPLPSSMPMEASKSTDRSTPLAAPWSTVARPISISRIRTKSVADIFAPDAPQPPSPYRFLATAISSAPKLRLPEGLAGLASSPEKDSFRRRSMSLGTGVSHRKDDEQGEGPLLPRISQLYQRDLGPKTLCGQSTPMTSPTLNQGRRITITSEEQKQRYHAALGRLPAEADPSRTSRGGEMTLSELQARHLAKLRQLQNATTVRLTEAETLATAKEDWERRKALERREQVEKSKKRRESISFASESKHRDWSTPQRLKPAGRASVLSVARKKEALEEAEGDEAARHQDVGRLCRGSLSLLDLGTGQTLCKRTNGLQRTKVWRKSMILPSGSDAFEGGGSSYSSTARGHHRGSLAATPGKEICYSGNAARTKTHPRRYHSTAGLLTIMQDTSPSGQDVDLKQREAMPIATATADCVRQVTAIDLRKLREGTARAGQP